MNPSTKTPPSSDERDRRVLELHEQLLEIEQRLIPTGLHVFGRPSRAGERTDMLKMIASFDRPEAGARALPQLVAEGLGLSSYRGSQSPSESTAALEAELRERERVDVVVAKAFESFELGGTEAAVRSLETEARVNAELSRPVFLLLEKISKQLETNNEIEALLGALRGEYVTPGPGADIVQNPSILPTGRNTHAINPYAVPSAVA
ncbi:MAG TPA: cobaltochelatase subunit CobN, partial [Pyrinomonadaceae bacterium]|nr:cobaltochelatase subunit CobN [Pyrinomonadaceae bacterium]